MGYSNIKEVAVHNMYFIFINIHWRFIEMFTYIIIYLNKAFFYIKKKLHISNKDINNINIDNNNDIHQGLFYIIYDGYETLVTENIESLSNSELILYKTKIDNKQVYKIKDPINFDIELFNNNCYNETVEISDIYFLAVIITINETKTNITNILKNNDNYFYINDSKLFTPSFVKWFCNKFTNLEYSDDYEIDILTDTVENISLNKNKCLTILKNNYYIESI